MTPATPQACAAVRAAKNLHRWGVYAAYQYAIRRGASRSMVDIAARIECTRRMRAIMSKRAVVGGVAL